MRTTIATPPPTPAMIPTTDDVSSLDSSIVVPIVVEDLLVLPTRETDCVCTVDTRILVVETTVETRMFVAETTVLGFGELFTVSKLHISP
jgi:hypothetical protein